MAIRNYTTGKTKINFSINTCPPKMTNDEYNARCDKFDKFVLDIKTKYQDDLTIKQIKELGLILKNIPGKKVDVHNPDYLLKIEIRHDYTYIYSKEIPGLGGYPLGVAGKGLLM